VTYRNPDGSTGTLRTGSEPGERIKLGSEEVPVAWDVPYSYEGDERTVRMEQEPGDRLPVLDGRVVLQAASAAQPDGMSRQYASTSRRDARGPQVTSKRGRSNPAPLFAGWADTMAVSRGIPECH